MFQIEKAQMQLRSTNAVNEIPVDFGLSRLDGLLVNLLFILTIIRSRGSRR